MRRGICDATKYPTSVRIESTPEVTRILLRCATLLSVVGSEKRDWVKPVEGTACRP